MSHSQEWHDLRRTGIGGSDAPVIMLGFDHPFTTPLELWREKMGMGEPKTETPAMRRGSMLEPLVREMYIEETGRMVEVVPEMLRHPVHTWMIGNIDGRIIGERLGTWECKVPGMKNYMKCKNEGPLEYYMIQMMHYLGVNNDQWGSFSIFNAELWEMTNFDVERDDEFIGMLMAKESEFMDNVKNGTPPTPTTVKEDKLLLPKVNYESEVVKIDSEGWLDAVRTFRLARQLREEAEEVENGAKERLINLMTINNAEVAEGGGIRCYYRESKGRKTFDYKAFMDSHPDMDLQPWFKVGNSSKTFKTYFISRGSAYDE